MKYQWLDTYETTKKHAVRDYKVQWQATRFLLDGKMFALLGTDDKNRPIISVKLAPEYGQLLRDEYNGKIIPGYYLNKLHWNSIYLDLDIEDDLIKELIDESYQLIFKSLTQKKQALLML